MSYLDRKNIPGSNSPNTVWLRKFPSGVFGMDYETLNDYIREYNNNEYYKFLPFWYWLTEELHMEDALPAGHDVVAFDILWNDGNVNLNKVYTIKSWRNPGEDEQK